MSIAIISTLPQSALPSLVNASAEVESSEPTLDFTSLLLGQLAVAAQSGAESNLGAASEFQDFTSLSPEQLAIAAQSGAESNLDTASEFQDFIGLLPGQLAAAARSASDSGHAKPAGDEYTEAGDPLDVLAVLIPCEQAGKTMPVENGELSAILPEMAARAPFTEQGATNQGQLAANPLPAPASEPAAKFAVPVDGMVGEDTAHIREPAQPLPVTATVATGVQGSREAAPPTTLIPTPLHSGGWSGDFAQTVTWVATRRYQSAELTLNPPALGNIEISLKLDSDRSTASAVFVSSNAEVREAIETALPKLREMLAGAGIELGQTNVSAESFRQGAYNEQGAKEGASSSRNDLAILEPDPQAARAATPLAGTGQSLVDMFV